MKTFTNVMLIVLWLLGAGGGISTTDPAATDRPAQYRYAMMDGIDMAVHDRSMTLHLDHRVLPRTVALAVPMPSWVAALLRPAPAAAPNPNATLTASSPAPYLPRSTDAAPPENDDRSLPHTPTAP